MANICESCGTIVSDRKEDITKHNQKCLGELFEVDEWLLDTISKYVKSNIQTYYCCAGHKIGKYYSIPYLLMSSLYYPFIIELKKDPKYKHIKIKKSSVFSAHVKIATPTRMYVYNHNGNVFNCLKHTTLFIEFLEELYELIMHNTTSDNRKWDVQYIRFHLRNTQLIIRFDKYDYDKYVCTHITGIPNKSRYLKGITNKLLYYFSIDTQSIATIEIGDIFNTNSLNNLRTDIIVSNTKHHCKWEKRR